MRISYLPLNIDGAGCYRCIFPSAYLSERGHEAGIPGFVLLDGNDKAVKPLPGVGLNAVPPGDFNLMLLEETLGDPEIVVVQLGSKKWQWEWALKLKEKGTKIVLELDDDIHRVPSYNPGQLTGEGNGRQYMERILEFADHVTVATQPLKDFYQNNFPNKKKFTVLRNRLHWPMWNIPPVYERKDWKKLRVGYMGNMDYHGGDLKTIARPLHNWLKKHPDVEFVAAGDPRIHKIVRTPKDQQVTTSKVWFRNMDLAQITSTFDIGLIPLVRNEFNWCKSWLKGMEYAACGIPCLATPSTEYLAWMEQGEIGMECFHPISFIQALDELYEDREKLEKMGYEARRISEQSTYSNHIQEWEEVYQSVLSDDPDPEPTRKIAIAGKM